MLSSYRVPSSINYFWNFGVLAGLALVIQLITGIALAMHYTPHIDLAFQSVDHIMRDLPFGWLLRYLHSNGASLFFMVVYTHIFRGIYYGSYANPRLAWTAGVAIYVAMMAVSFLGYVLPWGQMSFWGATVITNFFSIIPVYGRDVVEWIWGGYAITNATLNRFYSLHYFLAFVVAGLAALHLIVLHNYGPNNPLGTNKFMDTVPFYPYFYVKDMVGIVIYLMVYFYFVFFAPEVLGHSDNYIPANPMVTPPSIVPEWYFLPMYAILRSIPHKTAGVLAMGLSICSLFLLPLLTPKIHRSNAAKSPLYAIFFWLFVLDCFLLGVAGSHHVESPWVELGQIATGLYFSYFFVILPMLSRYEAELHRRYLS